MAERRYDEQEVAAIFERAATAQTTAPTLPARAGQGMTLAQLQAIGHEVGIAPALVADAARALDAEPERSRRTLLGFPIAVGRTVQLDRRLSDAEWEQLVVELRGTFAAVGQVERDGSLRQWRNGNLHCIVEPTALGDRVRLGTLNWNARGMLLGGVALGGMAGALIAGLTVAGVVGNDPGGLVSLITVGLAGLGMFSWGAALVPRWARTRARQMDQIATRLTTRPALPAHADR